MDSRQNVHERVLDILSQVSASEDVRTQPDLPLYASGLLDSLGTVTLMVELGEALGMTISPAEFDVDAWATPRKLLADVDRRLASQRVG